MALGPVGTELPVSIPLNSLTLKTRLAACKLSTVRDPSPMHALKLGLGIYAIRLQQGSTNRKWKELY